MNDILIYNQDCIGVIRKLIKDNIKVDMVLTDPPYQIDSISGGGTVNTVKKLNKSLDDLDKANIIKGFDYNIIFPLWDKIMKNINIYAFCNKKQIPEYLRYYYDKKKCTFDILFWHKNNALPTYSNKYLSDCEYIMHFRKKSPCKPKSYEDAQTVYFGSINHQDKKKYKHPTVKPLDLVERFIRNSTKEGDIVFDPYMGSGTTAVACKNLNRKFIGSEINPEYFEIAKKRINGELD